MTRVTISKKALWDLYSFAVLNLRSLQNAKAAAWVLSEGKKLVYSVDFADIYPFLFPGPMAADLVGPAEGQQIRSLHFLWDALLSTDSDQLPFKLAITPATRLEILDCFRHLEGRVSSFLQQRFPAELRSLWERTPSEDIAGLSERFSQVLKSLDPSEFQRQLRLISQLSTSGREPADKLAALLERRVVDYFESALGDAKLVHALAERELDEEVFRRTLEFLQERRQEKHTHFHNCVDALNLSMIPNARSLGDKWSVYATFLTHSWRTLSAGEHMSPSQADPIAQHSVAALYLVKAAARIHRKELTEYFSHGAYLAREILAEMESIESLADMKLMSRPGSENLLTDDPDPFSTLSARFFDRLQFFVSEYYGIIDESVLAPPAESGADENDIAAGSISIRELTDLLVHSKTVFEEIRHSAKRLLNVLDPTSSPLGDLYLPKGPDSEEVLEWLGKVSREEG
jgi:hypothetical protein